MSAMSGQTAILIVGDWNTQCSACGWNCDAGEATHETVLSGYPLRQGQPDKGCGALFVGMEPSSSARIVPGIRPCGYIATLRPDLPLVGAEAAGPADPQETP